MSAPAIEPARFSRTVAWQLSSRAVAEILLAGGFVAVWGLSLSRSLFDPIGFDQGMYQYMAERVLAGDRLYVDVWDQNGPGIIAIHCISTCLIGSSPLAHRIFDAIWQGLTLILLIALVVRDGKDWATGWLVALLYALSYYSLGYIQTAQREGFAVLPMLASLFLVSSSLGREGASEGAQERTGPLCDFLRCFLAGVLCLFVASIKTPLGLLFGGLWLYLLHQGWTRRRQGLRAWAGWSGLNAGFILWAAATVAFFLRWGCWDGLWGVLSRRDMPGYVVGPVMIREIAPLLLVGVAVCGGFVWITFRAQGRSVAQYPRAAVLGCIVFATLLTARQWPEWQNVLTCFAGLFIPVLGGLAAQAWKDRTTVWRLMVVMLAAAGGSLLLQGYFFKYHLPPILACAAYLAGVEVVERVKGVRLIETHHLTWAAVCTGGLVYLAVGQWWPTMSFVTARPYVLAGTTLSAHYDAITKHKLNCPTYTTTVKVADRIRELTAEDEPIATLFHEARVYCFARRPSVYKLLSTHSSFKHMFSAYMQAIEDRRPKVIAARVPQRLRDSKDMAAIQSAVCAEAEHYFGSTACIIREAYRVTELIDDVCLLTPVEPGENTRIAALSTVDLPSR